MKKISPEIFRLIVLFTILGILALLAWQYSFLFLDFLRSWNGVIGEFIREHYTLSIILFILIYIVDNVLVLPIASLLTMAAGFFYGPSVAIIITTIAATCGATFAFIVARYVVGIRLQRAYEEKLGGFNELFLEYGTIFLLLVRLIPAIPFVMVNVLAGLTIVSLKKFVWTTAVGMLPVTTLLAFSGQEFQSAASWVDLMNTKIILLFVLMVFLLLVPSVLKKFRLMV